MRLLLHDDLLDLDNPVQVTINDEPAKTYKPKRSTAVIREALKKRLDPASTPSARIVLE